MFQLAEGEREYLRRSSTDDRLTDIFLLWTLKEAYTKALGLGLGFDFSRIEYDFDNRTLEIDGRAPVGWRIRTMEIALNDGKYRCCVAEKREDVSGCEIIESSTDIRYLQLPELVL